MLKMDVKSFWTCTLVSNSHLFMYAKFVCSESQTYLSTTGLKR